MKTQKYFFSLFLLALLTAMSACTPVCPTKLTAAQGYFESDGFTLVDTINIKAVFINTSPTRLRFTASDTFDVWLQFVNNEHETADPAVVVNSEPTSEVAPGETMSYDITVSMGRLKNMKLKIIFKGRCSNFGDLTPDQMSLASVTFTCTK